MEGIIGSQTPHHLQSKRGKAMAAAVEDESIHVNSLQQIQNFPVSPALDLYGTRQDHWWTGKRPIIDECPGMLADGTLTSIALPDVLSSSRQEILDYFDNTWTLTEVLFASLQGADSFTRKPHHKLRHPKIFYYGHPAALYVNKMRCAGVVEDPINPYFESIFETGVDEMGWDDLSQAESDWPTVEEVHAYRIQVYELVKDVILNHECLNSENRSAVQGSQSWSIFMGFEHERIHLETSSVLIRELPLECVQKPAEWVAYHPSTLEQTPKSPTVGTDFPENPFLAVPGGEVKLGKDPEYPSFGWDNEYGQRVFNMRPFEATKYMITNGEFYDFVVDGGYQQQELWTQDGWGWRTFNNAKCPTFWRRTGPHGLQEYNLRVMFDEVEMRWDWPVDVNCHEAQAFCRWRSKQDGSDVVYRLLTEPEHALLKGDILNPTGSERELVMMNNGDMAQMNLNLAHGSSSPVGNGYAVALTGHEDVVGNGWEWVEDQFCALPGFAVHPIYEDFSTPCFDGEHNMIKGGSWMSTGANGASEFSRFAFRPHFFQHSGFRMVRSDAFEVAPATSCEGCPPPYTGRLAARNHGSFLQSAENKDAREREELQQFLNLHYGMAITSDCIRSLPADMTAPFSKRCADLLTSTFETHGSTGTPAGALRALDVGCAVGGATFELARDFEQVIGLDISAPFIQVAQRMAEDGQVPFTEPGEGELRVDAIALVDPAIDRTRVSFRQMDAMCISPELQGFDAVVAANVLDDLASPSSLLGRMGGPQGLVAPGGVCVIASPYQWDEAKTPKTAWLGGYNSEVTGEMVSSYDGVRDRLGDEFELIEEADVPILMRQKEREFKLVVSHATVWKRRAVPE
jgi:5-histidylcysteine sulfoxide synthase/putative 4-mercaptohistidine N1-methyltranferase